MTAQNVAEWTRERLLALPPVVPIQVAFEVWGLSRSRGYAAHAAGTLPFPTVSAGCLKVTRAALLRSLDISEGGPASPPIATDPSAGGAPDDTTDGATLRLA